MYIVSWFYGYCICVWNKQLNDNNNDDDDDNDDDNNLSEMQPMQAKWTIGGINKQQWNETNLRIRIFASTNDLSWNSLLMYSYWNLLEGIGKLVSLRQEILYAIDHKKSQ